MLLFCSSSSAVDRSLQSNIGDARDALVNVCVDVLSAYKATLSSSSSGLYAPSNLRLLPLFIAALLKSVCYGFQFYMSTSSVLNLRFIFLYFRLPSGQGRVLD